MTRWITALAAIVALILIFVFFTGEEPSERTELPAADAPGAALESSDGADTEMEVNPQPGDLRLETDPIEPGVGEDKPDAEALDVTMPEGESRLDGELQDAPGESGLAEEDEEETGVTGEDEDPQR
ncbi:hypothetical protein [Hyphococcus luteus]|uniref:Uncharacterized protein n=1 Tax=Hyphococcus luteus TaxID=2058213 RepID=A0A2S7JZ92_9PROT|nr:hypothetical protein [Marinicaulis flavus]PQA85570.1 hypothetical protein CW354_21775 [Marinicaulis flavus]